jgi:hypothetical protein
MSFDLAKNQEEWMKRAEAQYMTHGVSKEKAFLWSQSRWHNTENPLSTAPEAVAEDDLANWVEK